MGAPFLFKILFAIPVLHVICYGQECDPNGISCINCTDYQKCSGGSPSGPIFSCENGARCDEKPLLEHCRIKLKCYAVNECSEVGIFPNAMIESNYFVCLPDSGSGFIKYDFTCPEGEFFDKDARMCTARAATASETTLLPSSETTTAVPTTPPTSLETTTAVPTTAPTSLETTTAVPTTPPTSLETTTAVPTTAPTSLETTSAVPTTPPTSLETTTAVPTTAPTSLETTTAVPTTAPTSLETTTAVPTTAPTSPPSPVNCTAPGIFPNPSNCKMYFRCSTSLKVFHYICPGISYFNENILKCSLIITAACQQQILLNTTTSTTPMTTSTTTRTPVPTKPPPTTTTTAGPSPSSTIATTAPTPKTTTITLSPTQAPITTTTTQVPTTPFSCFAAGTFENPLDCKTYYRCSSSGKVFLYVCPNGSYYNEFTKRCGLTITPRCRSKLSE